MCYRVTSYSVMLFVQLASSQRGMTALTVGERAFRKEANTAGMYIQWEKIRREKLGWVKSRKCALCQPFRTRKSFWA